VLPTRWAVVGRLQKVGPASPEVVTNDVDVESADEAFSVATELEVVWVAGQSMVAFRRPVVDQSLMNVVAC
jgi:hypothetical protein